jgi:transposase
MGHLLSWAGFVPRLDESAGKSRSTRIRKGASWLKPVLVQAAWGATRKKNSYFQAQFVASSASFHPWNIPLDIDACYCFPATD